MNKLPIFCMLVGLPGSGKTSFALSQKDKYDIISSDSIRKELYGSERIQENNNKVFEIMRKRAIEALKSGKNVIYDATNMTRKFRKALLSSIKIDCKKVACIIWAKYETCVLRDKNRNRTVGNEVLRRMIKSFQVPYYDEGWDEIRTIHTDELYNESDYARWVDCQHDNPHHDNTISEHISKVCKEVSKLPYCNGFNQLFIAAYLHDIGKKFTKSFKNAKGEITEIAHFYDHQNVSSYLAVGFKTIQDLKEREKMLAIWLINAHMEPFFNSKYYRNLSDNGAEKILLDKLHLCDKTGA